MTRSHPTSSTIKHRTLHRPQGLGGQRWEDNTMVLDTCTFLVASDYRFHNDDTNNKWIPYKNYTDFYPEWSIPADRSLESSLYWKWFLGHHSTKVEQFYGRKQTTKIPDEWRKLKWNKVKVWLKEEYGL